MMKAYRPFPPTCEGECSGVLLNLGMGRLRQAGRPWPIARTVGEHLLAGTHRPLSLTWAERSHARNEVKRTYHRSRRLWLPQIHQAISVETSK
ncbi:hypothetical protein VUR80DRAFT_429 [Thermomyces stellatus]